MHWISLFFFVTQAVSDLRSRSVRTVPCVSYLILALCWRCCLVYRGKSGLFSLAAAAAAGMILFLAAYLTGQQIGYGDCLILTAFGFGCGVRAMMELLFSASVLASFTAVILIAVRKADRKSPLPFVPFLAAAELTLMIMTGISGRY